MREPGFPLKNRSGAIEVRLMREGGKGGISMSCRASVCSSAMGEEGLVPSFPHYLRRHAAQRFSRGNPTFPHTSRVPSLGMRNR